MAEPKLLLPVHPQAKDAAWLPGCTRPFAQVRAHPLRRRRERQRNPLSVALLAVELFAVLALLAWLGKAFSTWRSLAAPVTSTPPAAAFDWEASSLASVELPGGHVAPRTGTVPGPLRHLYQRPISVAIPTPVPGGPTRIVIPRIGVDALVVEGDGPEELKMGVGHRPGTANPGQVGNMVLSGHNDIYGEVFRHLDRLASGDEVIVYSGEAAFHYRVRERRIVQPTELSVLAQGDEPILTLISCYPYLIDTHRIVVIAELAR